MPIVPTRLLLKNILLVFQAIIFTCPFLQITGVVITLVFWVDAKKDLKPI